MKAVSIQAATDFIFKQFQSASERSIRMATPLGLGKPNQLINAVYARVVADPSYTLDIFTALSLDPPVPKKGLEERFAKPFLDRHFGADYPRLQYVSDMRSGKLPPHIHVQEFYVEAGRYKDLAYVQENYVSLNYTHVVRGLLSSQVNLVLQLVAKRGDRYSLSCNTDLTLDFMDAIKSGGRRCMFVGVVHPDLPFTGGDAELDESAFDLLLESPEITHQLFALPKGPLDEVDTAIGLYASQLVADNGSLQIGIGSLSDALVHSLILRHNSNESYRRIMEELNERRNADGYDIHLEPFEKGLYGTSEMIMDGFMHLRKAGILNRIVQDAARAVYVHGAFFLGSRDFYQWIRSLGDADYEGFAMTRVSRVNDLYDPDENLLRKQRRNARFFNTCMNVTLLGGAASDTLPDGRVISGVGGQYNFVAMSHELPDARSILMLRSSSIRDGKRMSNIIESHGHLTIPRHLRDIVITEYGIASLMGKNDREVALHLIAIADAEFQDDLLLAAQKMGKVPRDFTIPFHWTLNTPGKLKRRLLSYRSLLPDYPFGSDFQPIELRILKALTRLKNMDPWQWLMTLIHSLTLPPDAFAEERKRMNYNPLRRSALALEQRLFMGSLALSDTKNSS